MKKLLLIAAFSLIYFIFGCTDTNQLAGPDNNVSVAEQFSSPAKVNWISLPQPINKSLRKSWTVGEFIPIGGSGSLNIQDQYEGGVHGMVSVNATIEFNAGSINPDISYFEGVNYLFNSDSTQLWSTLTVDDDYCSVNFTPHILFDQTATLNLIFTGIDLTGLNPDNIKFIYEADVSGEWYEPENSGIIFVQETGALGVQGAVIPHFSRYGFVN